MKLKLDDQFLDLKGCPLPMKMCDALAEALAMSSNGNPQKVMKWANGLINDGEININAADARFLNQFIMNHSKLTNLAKFQLLQRLPVEEKTEGRSWKLQISFK